MFWTRIELTGSGSVATAPCSASSIASISSGENAAFEKSFIAVSFPELGKPQMINLFDCHMFPTISDMEP
jgi:hypothetical protein